MTPRPTSTPFEHLLHLSDGRGTFEHALHTTPRRNHGYCTDDMARVLVVTVRQPVPPPAVRRLAEVALGFLHEAGSSDGGYRNRMDEHGRWLDQPSVEDCWGRAIWGLGTAAARADTEWIRHAARLQLDGPLRRRSPDVRAMAFAVLGAAEVLTADPDHTAARALLVDAADALPRPRIGAAWPWPEERLTYANAVLPEAMLACGGLLGRPDLTRSGLCLLGWLLERETVDGHLSVTPAGGAGPTDAIPRFDQQPIEVAAMADACARAIGVDADPRWAQGLQAAVNWFEGDNDSGYVMWDPHTGGGYDGLEADGPNRNQGAESTLAALSVSQHAHRLVGALR